MIHSALRAPGLCGKRVKATVGSTTTVYIGNYYERDNGTTVRKYYYAGGVRVAMRGNGTLYYLLTDHLGSTAITANASGARVTELRYYAYGGTRYDAGGQLTGYRYTGQRIEVGTGLYDYGARFYSPVLGRFLSADTIVPEPGNPSHGDSLRSQALNRYTYVLNNPLRYTDPTGMFSEDEIMKYLGVDSWEAVLALFEEGGRLDEQWGLLGALRAAEIGSRFTAVQEVCGGQLCSEEVYTGVFEELDGGVILKGMGRFTGNDLKVAALTFSEMTSIPAGRYYYVDGWRVGATQKVYTLKFDPSQVDWANVGLGVAGLGQDAGVYLAVAGATTTANPILLTAGISLIGIGTAAEATGVARSYAQYQNGKTTVSDLTVSIGTSIGGLFEGPVGIGFSVGGVLYDLGNGVIWTP